MYITSINAKQIDPPSTGPLCQVQIEWSFGEQIPDVVEIYSGVPGASSDTFYSMSIDKSKKLPTSTVVELRAGAVLEIRVCPRLLSGKTLKDTMPDEQGEEQYWESFCWVKGITTKVQQPGEDKPNPPTLSATSLPGKLNQRRRIVLDWTSTTTGSHYNIRIAEGSSPEFQIKVNGRRRSYAYEGSSPKGLPPETSCTFKIQQCQKVTFAGSRCSSWVNVTATSSASLKSVREFLNGEDASQGIKRFLKVKGVSSILQLLRL